jgi:hypothetical protein
MRDRALTVPMIALLLLALGPLVLGLDWRGHEAAPGSWRDGVPLWRSSLLWGVLAGLGGALARRVSTPGARLVTVVPLLAWMAWMLRGSALGPLAWIIYALPTLVAWLGSLVLGSLAWRRGHEPHAQRQH